MTYIDYGEDERIPYVLLRESVVKIRKPRRFSCGHQAQPGDRAYQTVGLSDGDFFMDEMDEHCEYCDYEMHGWESAGRRKHGNVTAGFTLGHWVATQPRADTLRT